jgi:NADH-quinone oxidoreductase subunit F
VDLRLTAKVAATGEERAAVDAVLGPPPSQWEGGARRPEDAHMALGGRAARERRHLLITVLHAVQERAGWISPGALDYVSERLTVPPAEAYGVVSFYAMFRTTQPPGTPQAPGAVVHICDDVACKVAGAEALCAEMTRRFGPEGTVSTESTGAVLDGPVVGSIAVTWQRSPCLGKCDQGSAALIQQPGAAAPRRDFAPVTPDAVWQALTTGESPAEVPLGVLVPQLSRSGSSRTSAADPAPSAPEAAPAAGRVSLLRRLGHVDPASLGSYRAAGGYEMLRRAIALGPQGVIREVRDAKLMGRGGAAFPTHIKWDAVAANPVRPKYVVTNADESEPGTFKDRVLMEADPYALVEALTIMGYACGAEQGFIYIRGEYPTAEGRLAHAVRQARAHGFLGADVMGEGFTFDIEVRRGAGAYIAGEETALINSLEGKRAEPRNKPPFPAQSGLFGKPTAVNNVETLLSVLEILRVGGPAYATVGTPASTGTRLFCLSGCVPAPGLYEYDFGVTLRDVIDGAGGVAGGRPLQAVLLGGAAGVFVGPDALDMPLTFEGVRAAGATLGSGVVLVLDDTVSVPALLRRISQFFRDESCGQCVPCRVGTVRQEELVARLADPVSGKPAPIGSVATELELLSDIGAVTRDASICGLGQTALSAVQSAVKLGLIGADS